MNRRTAIGLLAAASLSNPLRAGAESAALTADDEVFLDDMQRRACLYFVEQASRSTGQVLDRARADNTTGKLDSRHMASVSATGFGLTALCIADSRRYFPRQQIVDQVRRTLRWHADVFANDHGFYSHFTDCDTGKPYSGSEISSIDSAIFYCGALTARSYFHDDSEIVDLATRIYNRADWPYMLQGQSTFSMGVRNGAFIPGARWSHYCELMMIPLLALGSPTHPVDASVWTSFERPKITYDNLTYISGNDPLFTHQYSHAWFDFRHKHDQYANYFENSISATKAHEAFCLSLGKPYSQDYWGISASDSAHGYIAWGGPDSSGKGFGGIDGSVVPNATAGSLPFLPAACLRVQRALKERYGAKAWGRYGFCDALHPPTGYYDADVLGIDLGISLIMAENLRTGLVWDSFSKNSEVATAFHKAGFTPDKPR